MEEQNNVDKELDDLKVKHGGYEKGKSIIMRVALIVLVCLIFATITIFVYEKIKLNTKVDENASGQNVEQQVINQGNVNTNTQVGKNENNQTTGGQTTTNNTSSSNNAGIKAKTNKETIVDYGYQPKDFVDFVIDSMKIYSSMNILFNSPDGEVTASRTLPEEITNNELSYRNKIYEFLEDKNIVTKIYKDGDRLKCTYDEVDLLSKLGVSSHMGVGLMSITNNEARDGKLTYTFSDKFINSAFTHMDYYINDYTETSLVKNYYSNSEVTKAIMLSDKSSIQSYLTIQMAKIISNNKEEIMFFGANVKLNVNNSLQNVGYNLKNVVAIGKNTGNIYTFDTSYFLKTINKDSNFIWVMDGDTGSISCYVLTPGATFNNPIAIDIETDSVG
ncbi:MAG: hypothetical protein K0R72_141 [Clostridia bacterium]|jgi:hypothetical protein|nr:hypothetical protein [Clostridia bacterium]